MRCFIAISINEKTRDALGDLQRRLQGEVDIKKGDVKWVRPGSIHLTLKFLGEIKDEEVIEVCNVVEEVAARYKSFELDIEQVGCFGGRSARVLWVGTGDGSDDLFGLQEDLENQLDQGGWAREARKFSGHLTLCRIKNYKAGIKLAQLTEQYKDFKVSVISAEAITVYQSQLTGQEPVYTVLGNYKLK